MAALRQGQVPMWLWATFVVLVLGGAVLMLGAASVLGGPQSYYREPRSERAWLVHGDVTSVEEMRVEHRYTPFEFAVMRVDRAEGTYVAHGAPEGEIRILIEDYLPGYRVVKRGGEMELLITPHQLHDPQDENHTIWFDGWSLQDARAGCCWSSRVDHLASAWPVLLSTPLVAVAAVTAPRVPGVRTKEVLIAGIGLGAVASLAVLFQWEAIESAGYLDRGWAALAAVGAPIMVAAVLGAIAWAAARRTTYPMGWLAIATYLALGPLAAGFAGDFLDFVPFTAVAAALPAMLMALPAQAARRVGAVLGIIVMALIVMALVGAVVGGIDPEFAFFPFYWFVAATPALMLLPDVIHTWRRPPAAATR